MHFYVFETYEQSSLNGLIYFVICSDRLHCQHYSVPREEPPPYRSIELTSNSSRVSPSISVGM